LQRTLAAIRRREEDQSETAGMDSSSEQSDGRSGADLDEIRGHSVTRVRSRNAPSWRAGSGGRSNARARLREVPASDEHSPEDESKVENELAPPGASGAFRRFWIVLLGGAALLVAAAAWMADLAFLLVAL